jgi:galactoside O-acetyltransferase
MGFKSLGNNVLISDKSSIYGAENISIGNNVRIDDFAILSITGELIIGDYIHIGCYSSIIGKGNINIDDFVGISGRVSIYSSNDDYTGIGMHNPMIPEKYRRVTNGNIHIMKHSIIGCGCVILPNVVIGEGCSIDSLSLVKNDCEEFSFYSGNPAKKIKSKFKKFLKYEEFVRNNQ